MDRDDCLRASQRYQSRTEWARQDRATYRFALSDKKLFQECVARLPKRSGRQRVHTLEACRSIAQQFQTRKEWKSKDPSSYSSARKAGWLDLCTAHMVNLRRTWTKSACLRSARKHQTIVAWQKADGSAYITARKRGWMDECTSHMIALRSEVSFARCFASAQKYQTRSEWELNDLGAYKGALRNGWMDECTKHMILAYNSHTKETCKQSASHYSTITEWRNGDPSGYGAARYHGWLVEAASHMNRMGGTSTPEKELREELSKIAADIVGDYRVPGTRLRLDCFSPSKMVGIEYNGLYWHSEGKKGRSYHLDKTSACKAEGIRLIHIWEHEWRDRRVQVLSFLRSALNANPTKIGARKCEFRWVEPSEVRDLLESTHTQGHARHSTSALAVYHQGNLTGCATFGKHHRGKQVMVLNRLVFKDGVTVSGCFSKISKMAAERFGTIISWVDLAKSDGQGYLRAGWQVDEILRPDYFYWHPIHGVRSKQSRKKSAVKTPEGMTEREHAAADGWYRIYDCGKMRLIYK